ncbi:SRPBCC family protein [Gracilibacillus marinus]|jgi:uncharacterized protein YndB with AHSA1/START domain|uniref:SRPBCC family protein n=1 Tax=Gracilibacillus marinus TaxID=630535 RepID=A0ABV8VPA4_9BACI
MKEIIVYTFDRTINQSIDVVFDYVNDDEKIKLWNQFIINNIYENDTKVLDVGTKFTSIQKIDKKEISVDCIITEYEAPYKITIEATSKEGTSITKYLLSRDGHFTNLSIIVSIIPSNWYYKVMTKLFGWATKYIYEEEFNRLEAYLEENVELEYR